MCVHTPTHICYSQVHITMGVQGLWLNYRWLNHRHRKYLMIFIALDPIKNIMGPRVIDTGYTQRTDPIHTS